MEAPVNDELKFNRLDPENCPKGLTVAHLNKILGRNKVFICKDILLCISNKQIDKNKIVFNGRMEGVWVVTCKKYGIIKPYFSAFPEYNKCPIILINKVPYMNDGAANIFNHGNGSEL